MLGVRSAYAVLLPPAVAGRVDYELLGNLRGIVVDMSAGRPNPLDEPEFLERVAQCEAAGMTREQMCTEFEVKTVGTISRWRKDIRVQRRVREINRDRAQRVMRRVDSVMEARLRKADEIPTEVLLKIRKEYTGDNVRAQLDEVDDRTVGEARDWAADHPDLAKQLVDSFLTATEG